MNRLISIAIGAAIVLTLLSSSVFVVDQHRFAVVYALGELREVIQQPGLHVKLPAPLQNVVYLDKRLQTLDTADGERFLTAEKKDLLADAFVKWRISDPRQYLTATGAGSSQNSAERGAERVAQAVQVAMNAEIGTRKVGDVLSGQRAQIDAALRERIAAAGRQMGVEIVDVRLKRVDFTAQVSGAVIERMKADRIRAANETRSTGQAEAEEIRADAERQRAVILAEAVRDAETIKGEGDAKATQIYTQSFGKNPEFYRFYRSLEAYRATFKSRSDVLVLDSNSEFFKYFKGPGAGK
ncbi:protease modulator HflC [Massilia norwichensis]|uniref:Protein HflC n=1 Tax=Massilia norwichensis TaxID=1442366 RepID=A0ABT2AAS9_9BURK|nr:protease modulator HflC [Massilia norwichensis]MCS0591331.1 protease modulator HflC [Massilia norwichensis]